MEKKRKLIQGKVVVKYMVSHNKTDTVRGEFGHVIGITETYSMACVKLDDGTEKWICLETIISIDVLEPSPEKIETEEDWMHR